MTIVLNPGGSLELNGEDGGSFLVQQTESLVRALLGTSFERITPFGSRRSTIRGFPPLIEDEVLTLAR